MANRSHHRGLHHHLSPSAVAGDASGWVESIGALSDEHAATALLLGSPPAASNSSRSAAGKASGTVAAVAADGHAVTDTKGGSAAPGAAPAVLRPEQDFGACLEHALACTMAEVRPGRSICAVQSMPPSSCPAQVLPLRVVVAGVMLSALPAL